MKGNNGFSASAAGTQQEEPPSQEGQVSELGPTTAVANDTLRAALEGWRTRLASVDVTCRQVAMHCTEAHWVLDFSAGDTLLKAKWVELRARVSANNPVALGKLSTTAGADMLMATSLRLPTGQMGVLGVLLAPPHSERTIQMVLLSLGWLQLTLSAASLAHNQQAMRLLELIGHVASQSGARAAAQEWINRTAAWVRGEAADLEGSFALFQVRNGRPHWWVAADTAWAEKASPAVHDAAEVATRAIVEMQEVQQAPWWAMPLISGGKPTAVLVVRCREGGPATIAPEALVVLRASAGLTEPLLRRWSESDRSLARHTLDAVHDGWRKLRGPGHLTWKAAAAALTLALGVLLLWPVTDRVTAHTVIEGRTRQVVTAPFEGFIAEVLARPGEKVASGQLLARLDDRDLKLEQRKFSSEREQAAGKARQAMAEHDASALALAQTDVQQAESQLALVEAKLARAGLVAPMDGLLVTGDWVQQIGAPVEVGKEMFEIAATGSYRVVLHVADRDISRIQVGQPGMLRLTGQPQTTYAFEVSRVTATAKVEEGVNGFRVEAEWRGAVPTLSPGMQGVGKIDAGRSNLLTVWTRPTIDWLRLKLWSWWW